MYVLRTYAGKERLRFADFGSVRREGTYAGIARRWYAGKARVRTYAGKKNVRLLAKDDLRFTYASRAQGTFYAHMPA